MPQPELPQRAFTPQQVQARRRRVRREFLDRSVAGGAVSRLTAADVRLLFELYDEVFLDGYFQREFCGRLTFSLSTLMPSAAGKVLAPAGLPTLAPEQVHYDLRIAWEPFLGYHEVRRPKTVAGVRTRDALEALQVVVEHELCHLVELHCYGRTSCRGERFKALAHGLFGHTEGYHRLPTRQELAKERYGIAPGDAVTFVHNGVEFHGRVHRVNKRATVMVPDPGGQFQDTAGCRYQKWYVPLTALRAAGVMPGTGREGP